MVFNQQGQSVNAQVNTPKTNVEFVFRRHLRLYQGQLDRVAAAGDTNRAELLKARIAALSAVASEIGIEIDDTTA